MPLDAEFFRVVKPLQVPSMGTEHVSLLLYSLVSMLRPRSVLEIGAGYTTLFLVRAMADAAEESRQDRSRLETPRQDDERAPILSDAARREYLPHLYVIDHLGHPKTSAGGVPAALEQLGVSHFATVIEAKFVGSSRLLPADALPLDFIWFDCGAATNAGLTFLNEYWPLVNNDGGVIAFHSMHVPLRGATSETGRVSLGRSGARVPSPLLNEMRKQLADAGRKRDFELLSLVEPHKRVQGDVTVVRKLGPLASIRNPGLEHDAQDFGGRPGRLRRL